MTDQSLQMTVTDDEKYLALFSYVFAPIAPLIIMLTKGDEYKKNKPFVHYHYVQGLALSVVGMICTITVILSCFAPLILIASIYYGIKAYRGEPVVIPGLTDFLKNQKWV